MTSSLTSQKQSQEKKNRVFFDLDETLLSSVYSQLFTEKFYGILGSKAIPVIKKYCEETIVSDYIAFLAPYTKNLLALCRELKIEPHIMTYGSNSYAGKINNTFLNLPSSNVIARGDILLTQYADMHSMLQVKNNKIEFNDLYNTATIFDNETQKFNAEKIKLLNTGHVNINYIQIEPFDITQIITTAAKRTDVYQATFEDEVEKGILRNAKYNSEKIEKILVDISNN